MYIKPLFVESYAEYVLVLTVNRLSTLWETQAQALGLEDSSGEENGNPLQYYCLENPMDRGAC